MRVNLRTGNGHYLRAYASGVVAADAPAIGELDEWWTLIHIGGDLYGLQSVHGTFLSALDAAECRLRGLPEYSVTTTAQYLDKWEAWHLVPGEGGTVGLRSWLGRFLCAEGGGGREVIANREQLRSWESFTPSAPIGSGDVAPVGGHPDPLVGQLRVEGGAYVDDTGPRLPVFLHLGDIIGHGLVRGLAAILPALDFAQRHGYHGIRSWFQLKITTGKWLRGPTEDGWDPRSDRGLFVAILKAAADRGLKWHIAGAGTRGMSEADERDVFGCLSDAIAEVGPQAFALVEGVNEARDTARDATPAAIAKLIKPLRDRHPQPLYGLSAYTGHEDREVLGQWTPSWMPFYLVHGSRDGRAHDKIRHIFSLGYDGEGTPTRRLGWQGEPWGPGRIVSAMSGHGEIDANVMILGACMAAMARQAWVVMSGPGVVYGDEPLEAMPGLADVPGVVRRLPQDLMRFRTFSHSGPGKKGTRVHAVRDDAPDVREDYAIADDGRFVAVRYGPPHQRQDFPRERVVWDLEVLHEGPRGRVITGRLS